VAAKLTNGQRDVFICSKLGMAIRFSEDDVRPMGRTARGVIGMSLDEGDQVVAMEVLAREGATDASGALAKPFEILTVTDQGYGKRTPVVEYRFQSRGGKGVINMKANEKTGSVMGSRQVLPNEDVMLVSNKGQMIRVHVGEISEQGRNTQGVRVMTMSPGEKVMSFEGLAESVSGAVAGEDTTQGPAGEA
jgi:DNA gyrase subunit A